VTGLIVEGNRMTDMITGSNQSMDSTSNSGINSSTPPAQAPASTEERLFRQSDLNEIVGREKHEAVERYKRSLDKDVNVQSPQHEISEDRLRKIAAEETVRLRDEWSRKQHEEVEEREAHRIANDFITKLNQGKDKYSDFDEKVSTVKFGKFPNVVELATTLDNVSDVMYELSDNPTKLIQIQQLALVDRDMATRELNKLSKSIKDNQAASTVKLPKPPLSQLRPSNTGTDSAQPSIRDLKARYRA